MLAPMLPWINSGISLLTLIVLTWTLWWLRRYTIAAEEQVEALQKPFLAVTWEKLTDFETNVELQKASWEQRRPRLGKVPSDGFAVRKLGTGLALNVSFQLISVLNGKVLKRGYASSFPYLSSTESLQTDIGPSVLYDAINRSALDESENLELLSNTKVCEGYATKQ